MQTAAGGDSWPPSRRHTKETDPPRVKLLLLLLLKVLMTDRGRGRVDRKSLIQSKLLCIMFCMTSLLG